VLTPTLKFLGEYMGKSVLISRYGAYGDILHMSHLPRMLKEECGFDYVAVDTNFKGYQILSLNPFIDKFYSFNKPTVEAGFINKRWEILANRYDKFINLFHTLEYGCLAMEDQSIYYMDSETRRKFGAGNYYDLTTIAAGYPNLIGRYMADIYFSEKEINAVEFQMRRFTDNFVVMLNLSGSGLHKRLIVAKKIAQLIRAEIPDAKIITTGDATCQQYESELNPDFSLISIGAPFNQAMCTLNYVDCVIGHESGLMVASNALRRPTIQLMTAASLENHPNGCENDYSLQSPAYCSPCHKGPYRYIGCPEKDGLPLCVHFNPADIMERINEIYKLWKSKRA